MPTTARSAGSHCGEQAPPWEKERDSELGRARPSNGDCGGEGMPTTAISTGSHCSGQARTKERDSGLLGGPTASE